MLTLLTDRIAIIQNRIPALQRSTQEINLDWGIMSEFTKMPSLKQVKQTVVNSRRRRQELELACLELEDLILKIEVENIQQRQQQLNKVLNISNPI
ncbi:hypothetical protein STA3757_12890 [Stanieria sp. NIES-3757]|nr:hypothetical protein STA3757_12890 [Stanieria sp. NIES-3757]